MDHFESVRRRSFRVQDLRLSLPAHQYVHACIATHVWYTNDAIMDDSTPNNHESRLLSLAPELRNRIYRFALLSSDRVVVQDHTKPPPLLEACHQIRTEAYAIYYRENIFLCRIFDLDASLLIRWCAIFPQYNNTETPFGMRNRLCIQPSTNWDNLIIWLEAVFNNECTGPSIREAAAKRRTDAICALFLMTIRLRKGKMYSWTEAKALLEDARAGFAALDSA